MREADSLTMARNVTYRVRHDISRLAGTSWNVSFPLYILLAPGSMSLLLNLRRSHPYPFSLVARQRISNSLFYSYYSKPRVSLSALVLQLEDQLPHSQFPKYDDQSSAIRSDIVRCTPHLEPDVRQRPDSTLTRNKASFSGLSLETLRRLAVVSSRSAHL